MKKVKYGVIGLGWFGEMHCEALAAIPNLEIHALCTRTPDRLAKMAQAFGVANAFTDFNEMLADPELDAVSIVTMWDQHRDPAIAALRANKHVLLEKPMASTIEECDAIIEQVERSDRAFMVGHVCRFNPRYAAAKQEIEAGKIGKIVSMYARRNVPAAVTEGVLRKIGPIIGDGVHDTDLMLWYTGAEITSAYAQTVRVRDLTYPDIGWTTYRFSNGAIGVLENVWCLPEKTPFAIDERMEIIGTEGSIHVHEGQPSLTVCDADGWRAPDTTYWPLLHGARAGALRDELSYFINCILEGRKPDMITPRESREAVRACLAAEESAATDRIVQL